MMKAELLLEMDIDMRKELSQREIASFTKTCLESFNAKEGEVHVCLDKDEQDKIGGL
jgi:hypothetical protein